MDTMYTTRVRDGFGINGEESAPSPPDPANVTSSPSPTRRRKDRSRSSIRSSTGADSTRQSRETGADSTRQSKEKRREKRHVPSRDRTKRREESSPRDSRRESVEVVVTLRTSQKLKAADWPLGYGAEEVDKLTVAEVNDLR